MKKLITNLHILIIITSLSIVIPISLESQKDMSKADYYNWFDDIVTKTNSGVFKGTEYFERFNRINERHQYFKTSSFSNGSVVYNGQLYFNIPLKYDVFDDKLLIKDPNTLNAPVIELDKNKISSFIINGHKFIHVFHNEKSEVISKNY